MTTLNGRTIRASSNSLKRKVQSEFMIKLNYELKRTCESIFVKFSTSDLAIDDKQSTHVPDSGLTLNESFSRLQGHIEQATSDNTRRLLYWKNLIDN